MVKSDLRRWLEGWAHGKQGNKKHVSTKTHGAHKKKKQGRNHYRSNTGKEYTCQHRQNYLAEWWSEDRIYVGRLMSWVETGVHRQLQWEELATPPSTHKPDRTRKRKGWEKGEHTKTKTESSHMTFSVSQKDITDFILEMLLNCKKQAWTSVLTCFSKVRHESGVYSEWTGDPLLDPKPPVGNHWTPLLSIALLVSTFTQCICSFYLHW